MEYVRLGWSGLKVSRICLGCMSFGNVEPWMVEEENAKKVIDRALDLGINFFDTANTYSRGRSEEITGKLLRDVRQDVVIATKVYGVMGDKPNQRGLSRKHIMHQAKESLRRLGTDYIDLYQTHRWDYDTPIEETLSTLNDLVREDVARYIGASSMWAWQLTKALYTSRMKGYEQFVSMQNKYSLLYREEEREMIPLCKDQNIGIIPYNPTGVGVLSGRYLKEGKIIVSPSDTRRLQPNIPDPGVSRNRVFVEAPANTEIVKRTVEVAQNKGVKPVHIALAWLLHKGVTAPIIGTTNPEHVEEAVQSLEVHLSNDEMKYLEEPYKPMPVIGHD